MSRYRPKSRRNKKKANHKLTPLQKQEIITLREMGYTYKAICEKTMIGYGTVEYTCTKAKFDPEVVKKARAEAMERAARVTMEKATQALEAITPDSLRHDVVVHKNEDGSIKEVKHFGQSALQNATTFGILADKATKFADRADQLHGLTPSPLSPANLGQLVENLGERVRKITQTTEIEFGDLSELEKRIEALKAEATDADFEELPSS